METIGLVGGIAAGKSTVASIFAQRGCAVFDADFRAKTFLDDADVLELLYSFGMRPEPKADINWLRATVFTTSRTNRKLKARLERLIYPKLIKDMEAFIAEQLPFRHVILDIPLLFEKGLQDYCDLVVFVYAPYHQRLRRSLDREWGLEGFLDRELWQFATEQKEQLSDIVIPSGDEVPLDRVKEYVDDVLHKVEETDMTIVFDA